MALLLSVTWALAVAPTDILLNNATIVENSVAGAVVGTLTPVDADVGDGHLFSLVSGSGSVDNGGFTITGNQLKVTFGVIWPTGIYVDYETTPLIFSIRIRVIDSSSQTYEKMFQIIMTDDRNEDADSDGLSEILEEDLHGTSDLIPDSDNDGFNDRSEVIGNSNPLNPTSWPAYPLVGWGTNSSKELKAPDNAAFVDQTTGQYHSLGLKTDGSVEPWGGFNIYGQTTPPAGLANVVAVAAGGNYWIQDAAHSLALKADGTVAAWGYNYFGQTNLPVGLGNVVGIAAGRTHSVALKSDGTVVAWGGNIYGQCDVPAGLTDVISVAARGGLSVALKGDGTVVAWGMYFNGEQWVNAAAPLGLSDVVDISTGQFHCMALREDGTVVAWGYNLEGQSNVPEGLDHVVGLATGGFHSLALKDDGSVVGWGANGSGQRNIPASAMGQVKKIAAGFSHSIALRDTAGVPRITSNAKLIAEPGGLIEHQITLSNGVIPTRFLSLGLPEGLTLNVNTGLLSGSLQMAARRVVTIMVDTNQGRLIQTLRLKVSTGLPPTDLVLTPAEVRENSLAETVVGTLTTNDPDVGENHVFELITGPGATDNTKFVILGDQLKLLTTLERDYESNNSSYSIRVKTSDASLNPFEKTISIALLDDREEDADGDGLTEEDEEDIHGTSDVNPDTDGDGFSDGFEFNRGSSPVSATSFPSGRIVGAWGDSGDARTVIPAGLETAIDLAAGWRHNLALKSDGTVTAWGWNEHGQCNLPLDLSGVVAVEAGDVHSLVLKSDGTVVAWGGNQLGQTNVPANLENISAISAGSYRPMPPLHRRFSVQGYDNFPPRWR